MSPDVSEGLSTVAECIRRSSREIVDEVEDETENGESISGFIFTHGREHLAAITTEDSHFFNIQLDYDVVNNVAEAEYIKQQVDTMPQDQPQTLTIEGRPDDTHVQNAETKVAKINQNRDQEKTQQFSVKLAQLLSDANCGFEINDELNGPHGFQVSKKAFVYEPDYRASDFDEACQTIVSVAIHPRQFLQRAYNVEIDIEEPAGQPENLPPGTRGFQ